MTIQIKCFRLCSIKTIRNIVSKYYDVERITYNDFGDYYSLNFIINSTTCLTNKIIRLHTSIHDIYEDDVDIFIIETNSIM